MEATRAERKLARVRPTRALFSPSPPSHTPILPHRPILRALALAAFLLAAAPAEAQAAYPLAPPDTARGRYDTGGGVAFVLSEFGFGLGGLYRVGVGGGTSLVVEAGLGAGRDEREQRFFVGLFGETVTPFKRNYALLVPLHLGVEHRLFRQAIEDNFRPFVQLAAGPTLAYQWPYFRDGDGDGVREAGEARLGPWRGLGDGEGRLGVGGTLAVGAYFGRSRKNAQGLRVGYAASYFARPVELLEPVPDVDGPSRRFFGTPVVSFHLVRLVRDR